MFIDYDKQHMHTSKTIPTTETADVKYFMLTANVGIDMTTHVETIARVTRLALADLFEFGDPGSALKDIDATNSTPAFERVNVTFRCDGRIRGSMSAAAATLENQIRSAIHRASMDRRFRGQITRQELPRTSVEVWIQLSSSPLLPEERNSPEWPDLGLEGVEVHCDGRSAYYKPSVAITSGFRTVTEFLGALCRKAGLPSERWRDPDAEVLKTRWVCIFIEPCARPRFLRYLRTPTALPLPSRAALQLWALDCCTYFQTHQACDGAITYLYEPIRDQQMPDSPNLVRSCGCLFALSKATDNSYFLVPEAVSDTAKRLARCLMRNTVLWRAECRAIIDVESALFPKTGATALIVLALSCPTLKHEFKSFEPEFRNSLHQCQMDGGRFMTHLGSTEERAASVEFYPGQVLLALAVEVETGSELAAARCRAAFEPYERHFSAAPTTAFTGWQMEAWARLAIATGCDRYAAFAYKQADWLLMQQISKCAISEYVGGFAKRNEPPGFSSIVYVEALLAALRLATSRRDLERCGRYAEAVRMGLGFCCGLRLAQIPDAFFARPARCAGGIAMSYSNPIVRCDVVQHFLTMALAAYTNFDLIYA